MKKTAFLITLLIFSSSALYSSVESGAEFLKFEIGARPMGMGGAFAGVADDINSIWWNPAGLGSLEFKEFTLMHNEAGEGIRQEFTSFVMPRSSMRGTVGGSLNYFSVGDIQGYSAGGVRTDVLDAGSFGVNLAYGLNYLSPLYLGIKGGYIYEKLAGYDAYAFTVDTGLLWDTPAEGLRLGLNFMNMGTGLKFVEEESPLPFNVKAGLSYSFKLYGVSAIAAADGNFPAYGRDYYSLGTELHFFDLVFLRAGYKTQDDIASGVRLGGGLKNKNLLLDYAWLPRGEFNDSHRISLSLKLGRKFNETDIEAQIRNKFNRGVSLYNAGKIFEAYRIFRDLLLVAPRHEGVREYISRIELSVESAETSSLIREAAEEGKRYFNNDDLVRARSRFEIILELDPNNQTANEHLEKIDQRFESVENSILTRAVESYENARYEQALEDFNRVLTLNPQNQEATEYVEKIEEHRKEQELIRQRLKAEQEARIRQRRISSYMADGKDAFEKGRWSRAADAYEKVLDIDSENSEAQRLLADALYRRGRVFYEDEELLFAADTLSKALNYNSSLTEASRLLATVEEEKREKAQELSRRGLGEYTQGNLKVAINLWEKALQYNPKLSAAAENLKRARQELSD